MPGSNKKTSPIQAPAKPGKAVVEKTTSAGVPKWALPLVLLGTAMLYCRALQNGLTNFDDDFYITNNSYLKDISLEGIKAIFTSFYGGNYHPFTTLTWLFTYTKFGPDPLPYHFLSVLLHVINTWLVYKLSEQLSGKKITALVVCVLFAVHPMHVESVAWATELKDVLYTMFYLSSLLFYMKYLEAGYTARLYLGTLLLFICSLLSKSAAVTLPVLLVAIDVYKGRKKNAKALMEKAPFLLFALAFGILNIMAQNVHGAMTNLNSTYNIFNRISLIASSVSFYIIKLLAPFHLSAMHYFPGVEHGALPWLYYASLPFVAVIAWLLARKNAYRREMIFGVSFFLITISVMLQILAVGSALASERYTYIPYIGLFYIAGQWIADKGIKEYRKLTIACFSLVVVLFSVQTWVRIGVWENNETLFGDIIKKDTPHSTAISLGFFQRGSEKKMKGDIAGALDDFTQSALLCPKYENAHFNRGLINSSTGDFKSAIVDYTKVIELDPKLVIAYNYRGWAYYQAGDKPAAMIDYNKAISLDSANAQAYDNRAWAYYESHDLKSAIADYNKAISLDPANSLAYSNLANIKANTGDLIGALKDFDSLIKINPKDNTAYYTRAVVRVNLKDTAGACADWKKAAELGNKDAAEMEGKYCR